jgi:peptidoglycan LD-endopeptidase LytH
MPFPPRFTGRRRPALARGGRRAIVVAAPVAAALALVGLWAGARPGAGGLTDVSPTTAPPDDAARHAGETSPAEPYVFTATGMFVSAPRGSGGPVVPVAGVGVAELQNTWGAPRADERRHIGIDIAAPRGTPIMAALDGWIVSLSFNDAGGRGVHLLDRTGRYLLYYAHLDGYAEGLYPGMAVRQRELLGYVGTSGNAQVPHLHFEVGLVRSPGGLAADPLNPYHFLRGETFTPSPH